MENKKLYKVGFICILICIATLFFSMYISRVAVTKSDVIGTGKPWGLLATIENIEKVKKAVFYLQGEDKKPITYLFRVNPMSRFLLIFAYLLVIEIGASAYYILFYRRLKKGREHGSARLGIPEFVNRKISDKNYFKNRILTKNIRISVSGRKIRKSLNTLCIGGMGTGKSWFTLIPNLLQANTSFVVTDPSKELLKTVGGFLRDKAGYKVKVLDLEDMQSSMKYNFFKYIESENDIKRVVDIIFKSTAQSKSGGNDPMWENMAKDYLQSLVALLHYKGTEEEKNIAMLLWLANEDFLEEDENGKRQPTPVSMMMEELDRELAGNLASNSYKSATDGAVVTIRGVKSTLRGRIGQFLLTQTQELMSDDELELEKIGDEKTALFLVVPSEDTTFNFIISLLYAQLFPILYKSARSNANNKLKVPVQFFIDEMANFVMPKEFVNYLTTSRKHDISYMMFIQELQQLQKMFKDEEKTVIGTCQTIVYLGGSGKDTNKWFSEDIGFETVVAENYSRSYGMKGSSSKSQSIVKREVLTPDEIERMDYYKALVKVQGEGYYIDDKNDPTKHQNFKYCTSGSNPIYYFRAEDEKDKNAIGNNIKTVIREDEKAKIEKDKSSVVIDVDYFTELASKDDLEKHNLNVDEDFG